ncbi:hypothetical protein [Persicobacter diffluens]
MRASSSLYFFDGKNSKQGIHPSFSPSFRYAAFEAGFLRAKRQAA